VLEGKGELPGKTEQVLALEAVPDDDPQEPVGAKDATDQAEDADEVLDVPLGRTLLPEFTL